MRIELRDDRRESVGHIDVDETLRPVRVSVLDRDGERSGEFFLNWDTAVDDAGNLRRCVACECPDLFREKAFPPVTGFVVVLAFIGAVVGVLGLATTTPMLAGLGIVLAIDVAIFVFTKQRLVCYRCRTSYNNVSIARYHRSWDRTFADRYPIAAVEPSEESPRPSTPVAS